MVNDYKTFVELKRKIADINNIIALMNWDLETYIPEKWIEFRSQQIQTLSWISYDLSTSKELYSVLKDLLRKEEFEKLNEDEQKNVLLSMEDYERTVKYPKDFVIEFSKLQSESFSAWHKAKETDDFSIFKPFLEKLIEMKKQEAIIKWFSWKNNENIYDYLIDEFEPWMTCEKLDKVFWEVKSKLVPYIKSILEPIKENRNIQPKDSFLKSKFWTIEEKIAFSKKLSEEIGFDYWKGRLDKSSHPFTTSFSPSDVRITTRASTLGISETILSTIHEAGHWIYEQNLLEANYWLPLWQACSYWIHESQSLIWERNIAKSLSYWNRVFPLLKKEFSNEIYIQTIDTANFYRALNKVESSYIRTEADELTYHIHILIRYEIERDLLNDVIKVEEIPTIWKEKYKEYLDLDIYDYKQGCLQDVHWSHGAFWYFPSYSLWSFYATQFFKTAEKQIENLSYKIEKGEFSEFKTWLNDNIHKYWRKYTSEELCEKITGEKLNFDYFLNYVKTKYNEIYKLK